MAENVVRDLRDESLAVGARDARFPRQVVGWVLSTCSRKPTGSMWTLKSCGPSSPITAMWTRFLTSEKDPALWRVPRAEVS